MLLCTADLFPNPTMTPDLLVPLSTAPDDQAFRRSPDEGKRGYRDPESQAFMESSSTRWKGHAVQPPLDASRRAFADQSHHDSPHFDVQLSHTNEVASGCEEGQTVHKSILKCQRWQRVISRSARRRKERPRQTRTKQTSGEQMPRPHWQSAESPRGSGCESCPLN